jgi:hypothetical protein
MEENNPNLIPPDYSEEQLKEDEPKEYYWDEDDGEIDDTEDDEEVNNDEAIEQLLEEQNESNEKQQTDYNMSNNFAEIPQWGTPNQNQTTPPWGQQHQNNGPAYSWQKPITPQNPPYQSWNYGNSGTYQGNGYNRASQAPTGTTKISRPKDIIIIDVLDGLIESMTSDGKPNIHPRAIYDIKLKFDVWDALASFNPKQIYAIYPPLPIETESREIWELAFKYALSSLSSYLRLPKCSCIAVKQSAQGQPKELVLSKITGLFSETERKKSVFVGIQSGWYGLGREDVVAAKKCNLDYADIFQLIKGEV